MGTFNRPTDAPALPRPAAAGSQRAQLSDLPDDALMARAAKGDELAFEAIMRRHNQRLFRIARGVLADDAEAEDALQETYIRAFTNRERYEPTGRLGAWLARIAFNEALMRKRKLGSATTSLDEIAASSDDGAMPESTVVPDLALDRLAAAQARQLLEHAIDALPETFRMVVILRMVEELNIRETASFLGLNAATVKTRLHRGLALLNKSLERRLKGERLNVFEFDGARCDRIVAVTLERLRQLGAINEGSIS